MGHLRKSLLWFVVLAFLLTTTAHAWQENEDTVFARQILDRFESRGLMKVALPANRALSRWELALTLREVLAPDPGAYMTRQELEEMRELSRRFTPELQNFSTQPALKVPEIEFQVSDNLKIEGLKVPEVNLYAPNIPLETYQMSYSLTQNWGVHGGVERSPVSPQVPYIGVDGNLNEDLGVKFDLRYAEPNEGLPRPEGWEVNTRFVVRF